MPSLLKTFRFWATKKQEYCYIPTEDGGSKENDPCLPHVCERKRHHPSTAAHVRVLRGIIALLTIATVTLAVLYSRLLSHTAKDEAHAPRLNCGKTLAEAQARGCVYDKLTKAWLPAICPRVGQDEFAAAGVEAYNGTGWGYYLDRAGTQRLTEEDLAFQLAEPYAENGLRFWTTEREHVEHCAWLLMRTAHVLVTDARRDTLLKNEHHAGHCIKLLKEWALSAGNEDLDEIKVEGNVAFGSC